MSPQQQNQRYGRPNAKPAKPEIKPVFAVDQLTNVNYVELAEKVIKEYQKAVFKPITTTQLRNIFALLTELREIVRTVHPEKLDEDLMGRVQYVKMRFVYAAGRAAQHENDVRDFMTASGLIGCLDTIQDSRAQLELVCKYMEALVAYHKYYIDNK